MFDLFTDRARVAVVQAQEAARDLGNNYIGTEHVLLGLIPAEGYAALLLSKREVTADRIVERLRTRWQATPAVKGSRYIADDEALAALGIDYDAVRRRVEESFGE